MGKTSKTETFKPIESQRELNVLPKTAGKLDWGMSNFKKDYVEKDKDGKGSLSRLLQQKFKPKEAALRVATIEAMLTASGFNPALVHAGDAVELRDGVLYIELSKGTNKYFALKLDPNAKVNNADIYNELTPDLAKKNLIAKSRQEWESLKEALRAGILSDILAAYGLSNSTEVKNHLWKVCLKKEGVAYTKSAEQNREIVNYLRELSGAARLQLLADIRRQFKSAKTLVQEPVQEIMPNANEKLWQYMAENGINQSGEAIEAIWKQNMGRKELYYNEKSEHATAMFKYLMGLTEAQRKKLARKYPSF